MSMFRSPCDDSTSDPESSSGEENVQSPSSDGNESPSIPDEDVTDPAEVPLQQQESASESLPEHGAFGTSPDWLPNTAEQHATLLTSSLLEFAYNVKAAEHLNHAQGTTRFHRESPEARVLGARMYQGASKVLASSGIIADCVHEEDWREMRQQYIIGVDNLGLQAFNESILQRASPSRGRPGGQSQNLLIRRSSRPRQEFANLLSSTYLPGRLAGVHQRHQMMDAAIRKLAIPSPFVDMQLTVSPSAASGNRYKTEFQELKQVGKGGFGTVYHARNLVDNQDYAVKKIPLHSRHLRSWQSGGAQEVENLLREIRTLARLEHGNIVRYYSAWIEINDGQREAVSTIQQYEQLYPKNKLALPDGPGASTKRRQKPLPSQKWQDENSIDVAFNQCQRSLSQRNISYNDSMGIVFGEDSDNLSQRHELVQNPDNAIDRTSEAQEGWTNNYSNFPTSFSNDADVFTDGDGQVQSTIKKHDTVEGPVMVLHIQMSLHPLSLAQYLAPRNGNQQRHCFHLKPTLYIIRAILSGVQHLHSQGIVHRDLKPGNIFLSEHLEYDQRPGCVDITCPDCGPPTHHAKRFLNPRIGDFGLVAEISGVYDPPNLTTSSSSSSNNNNFPTKAVRAVGTEFYRPPSSHHHSNQNSQPSPSIDAKLDVFALGILLFELLYKMNTKMERHMLLSDLSKKGILPVGFKEKIDPCRRACCGVGGDEVESWTVGECVEDCIKNMVCAWPGGRWGCERVRERLDGLIGMLEEEMRATKL